MDIWSIGCIKTELATMVSEDCAMDIWSIGRIETELATMVSEELSAQMRSTLEFFHPFFENFEKLKNPPTALYF